ncbi:MAG: glycosyltransferase family 2 protein [Candidatus Cloacimonetes bacterium]|nr:glycosyltransferase family 2 protein [Candidatus Cloacimonadota bacterium]
MNDKILIVIPAYNEAENIPELIETIRKTLTVDFIIINDCSTDNTADIIKTLNHINLPINLGIGGTVQTGLLYALKHNYDIAVKMDGDGQHPASEMSKLLEPIRSNQADVVIGSRFLTPEPNFRSTFLRRKGIFIFRIVNKFLIKQTITDNTFGFRAYNKRAIEFLAYNYPGDYPEPEEVVLLGRNSFRIKEVAVKMNSRKFGKSSIQGWKNIYYMLKVLLAVIMTAIRKRSLNAGKC